MDSILFRQSDILFLKGITARTRGPYYDMKKTFYFRYMMGVCLTGMLLSACTKNLTRKTILFENDFETSQLKGLEAYDINGPISSNLIEDLNGSQVFGRFNNNTILLTIPSLPTHNAVQIEFDLNIHDKWDGNYLGATNRPDIWQMVIDNNPVIITSFSNTSYQQSYPGFYNIGNPSPAKSNAIETGLNGVCSLKNVAGGSSQYRIVKTVAHTGGSLTFSCNDALQPFNSLCLKSWSIDNLTVTAIKY